MRLNLLLAALLLGACRTADKADDTDTDTDGDVVIDADNDGANASIDCDDDDADNYPGNIEVCDGQDNDCDELVDDDDDSLDPSSAQVWYRDLDDDGAGTRELGAFCEAPDDAATIGGDCDDADASNFPGNLEICDGQDNDCDEAVDDDDDDVDTESQSTFYADADGDGFGRLDGEFLACDGGDAAEVPGDCDDDNVAVNPDAQEICNDGVDDDCDTLADDDDDSLDATTTGVATYTDADGDRFGLNGTEVYVCVPDPTAVTVGDDCDDGTAAINPGATEICNEGVDDDCDTLADDLDPDLDASSLSTFYVDTDGDGFGDDATAFMACDGGGEPELGGDCDETNVAINPGATEVCDSGVDNDCRNGADDADPNVDLSTATTFYVDADSDGAGGSTIDFIACEGDAPTTSNDCDDLDPEIFPGNTEVCDGKDNDCANGADDADPNLDLTGAPTWYVDGDGDGFGLTSDPSAFQACAASGRVNNDDDCDDGEIAINPDAVEICDGADNDCNDGIDELDAWWDTDWPYRVLIDVDAPSGAMAGAPVAADVDFAALLAQLGDNARLAPDSVRVVRQECALGQPALPAEFADGLTGLFDKVDSVDDPNDDRGTLAILLDPDGGWDAPGTVPAGAGWTLGVYFGSEANAGSVPPAPNSSTLVGSTDGLTAELSNDLTEALFAAGQGGLTTRVASVGRPTTGAQTSTLLGNGIYFGNPSGPGGSWVSAKLDTGSALELIHAGPVIAVLRASGNVSNDWGGFDYTYTYLLFHGRPELYAKASFVLDRDSNIGPQSPFWGKAVRPWMVNNNALASAALSEGDAAGDYLWARGGYATGGASAYGFAVGFRNSVALRNQPLFDPTGTTNAGRFVGLVGQDLSSVFVSGQNSATGLEGEAVVDHAVMAAYPHEGLFPVVQEDFEAMLEGTTVSVGAPEGL